MRKVLLDEAAQPAWAQDDEGDLMAMRMRGRRLVDEGPSPRRDFNGLTEEQAELLAVLAEECGEVVQMVGKILRHGLASVRPGQSGTNRERLEEELGDLNCVTAMLAFAGLVDVGAVHTYASDKAGRIGQYLHHAKAPR